MVMILINAWASIGANTVPNKLAQLFSQTNGYFTITRIFLRGEMFTLSAEVITMVQSVSYSCCVA